MLMTLPAELPNVANAKLPETYQAAKKALAACVDIDECKDWADKAEAMASYARQSGDRELRQMADRIQARALDRVGELLRQIPPAKTGPKELDNGGVIQLSPRQQAVHDAQLPKRTVDTALRINAIPRPAFEQMVESENPPTATQLANIGQKTRERPLIDLGERKPHEFEAATSLIGLVDDFLREAKVIKIDSALRGLEQAERKRLLSSIRSAAQWLSELEGTVKASKCPTPGKTSRTKSTKRSKAGSAKKRQ